ncbi:hypothetical protein GQE99_15240 [Maritimibacter sp. DP07]|jgi:DNA-binding NarL/FixJ family response regulator|uniref:HTH luxR-type domain-containing protein n=1 Tax=Maritimibacter harenae TaxID=2606218 RepID=A0A845M589_9RHOB|nr:hypothetical protein [Maritimibacter harenae]
MATVCEAFSNTEDLSTGVTVECFPDSGVLAKKVAGDAHDVGAVFLHLHDISDENVQAAFDAVALLDGTPVCMLLPRDAPLGLIRRCHANGARATVAEDVTPEVALDMLSLIQRGVAFAMINERMQKAARAIRARLSERELQVLEGICDGLQNKEIAHNFDIKEVTVKMHVRAIIRKLDAKNRTHAAMIARDTGVVG